MRDACRRAGRRLRPVRRRESSRSSSAAICPFRGSTRWWGAGATVGAKPIAMLLLHENATVPICHSKTRDLGAVTRQADILVAAIGRPGFITPEMVKPGATIIDVGINRIDQREEFEKFFAGNEN